MLFRKVLRFRLRLAQKTLEIWHCGGFGDRFDGIAAVLKLEEGCQRSLGPLTLLGQLPRDIAHGSGQKKLPKFARSTLMTIIIFIMSQLE